MLPNWVANPLHKANPDHPLLKKAGSGPSVGAPVSLAALTCSLSFANCYVQSVSPSIGPMRPASTTVPEDSEMSSTPRSSVKKRKTGPDYDEQWYTSPLDHPHIASRQDFPAMRAAYRACTNIIARAQHDVKRLNRVLTNFGELNTPHDSEEEVKEEPNIFESMEDEDDS